MAAEVSGKPTESSKAGIAKALEIILGLVFLLGALGKAYDIIAFAGEIHSYQLLPVAWLKPMAVIIVGIETAVSIALLTGFARRAALVVTEAMLIVFTGLLLYAWLGLGLESCGCFGAALALPMWASVLKNIVMIGMAAVPLMVRFKEGEGTAMIPASTSAALTFGFAVALALGLSFGIRKTGGTTTMASHTSTKTETRTQTSENPAANNDPSQADLTAQPVETDEPESTPTTPPDSRFGKFVFDIDGETWDLGSGAYTVAFFNATCEHCIAAVEPMNMLPNYFPEMPPVIAIMQGTPAELEDFRAETNPEFPTVLIDQFEFFEYVGSAPPRIYIIRDGEELTYWDDAPNEMDMATFLAEM